MCIVGKSITNNALLGYQATVTRATLTLGAALLALVAALVCSAYRAQVSAQKAPFKTERRRLQAKSMHELEAAKAKADAANKSKSEFLANMSHAHERPRCPHETSATAAKPARNPLATRQNPLQHARHANPPQAKRPIKPP